MLNGVNPLSTLTVFCFKRVKVCYSDVPQLCYINNSGENAKKTRIFFCNQSLSIFIHAQTDASTTIVVALVSLVLHIRIIQTYRFVVEPPWKLWQPLGTIIPNMIPIWFNHDHYPSCAVTAIGTSPTKIPSRGVQLPASSQLSKRALGLRMHADAGPGSWVLGMVPGFFLASRSRLQSWWQHLNNYLSIIGNSLSMRGI